MSLKNILIPATFFGLVLRTSSKLSLVAPIIKRIIRIGFLAANYILFKNFLGNSIRNRVGLLIKEVIPPATAALDSDSYPFMR
jgi:hypothetical protein